VEKVNNDIYDTYGDRWYTAFDDPVALLRSESKIKTPWILDKIKQHNYLSPNTRVLDIGCGAGFLSNELALHGLQVTGVDLSVESLNVARKYDATKSVQYLSADAYQLPFAEESFDVITAMDFLEHVEHPEDVIKEFSRVLKTDGIFIFHTFNRNPLAFLIIIKFVEWFVKNTPKNMHVLHLFIKPRELEEFCLKANMTPLQMVGIRPVFKSIPVRNILSRIVPETLRFEITKSLMLSYMGIALKGRPKWNLKESPA
jgi:2-polyprenyl-6-hydroxyphenyl methylase/3-demethylubiquinone-9 3-methyltransferase